MSRWRGVLLLALAVPLGASAFPPLPKPKENKAANKDLAKALQGTWEVTEVERGGVKGAKLAYQMTMTFDGEKLSRTLKVKDRELKAAESKFLLDASKSPAWLDLAPPAALKAKVAGTKGLVRVDGDKLIWTYSLGGGERPTKIDGDLSERQYRYTLKRVKK